MSDPGRYGGYYWCIKSKLSKSGEIYVNADRMEIAANGALICWGGGRPEVTSPPPTDLKIMLAIPAGKWDAFFAASCLDGHAVAVQSWEGEVVR
jgi:hypothetical protein